jgi:hypothetical protein
MTKYAESATEEETGRRLTSEDREAFARYLYEMMEEIEDDYAPGPPWHTLTAEDRVWYLVCAERLLRDHRIQILKLATLP